MLTRLENNRFADVNIPSVDIWTFLFEKPTDFPQDKGEFQIDTFLGFADVQSSTLTRPFQDHIAIAM